MDVLFMLNRLRLGQSCELHLLRNATCNFWLILENNMKQKLQPIMIKALVYKALERNTSETSLAKLWINNATLTPKKSPQKLQPQQPYFGLEIEHLKTLTADDWDEVKDNLSMLKAMVETYLMLKELDSQIPSTIYTKTVNCHQCGEILTWSNCPDNVSCCQWCLINNDLVWN